MRIVIGFICLVLTVFFMFNYLCPNKNDDADENSTEHNWANTDELANVRAKVLLTSRFKDLEDFKKVVRITYDKDYTQLDSSDYGQSTVTLSYLSNGELIKRSMSSGVSQADVQAVKESTFLDKSVFAFKNSTSICNRRDLERIFLLSRRLPEIFGLHDVAFYDLAEISIAHINTIEIAFQSTMDISEKGYINTFNHVTAQAIITSFFSEEVADFISDLHERKSMPELTTGVFKANQLIDSVINPLDNYIDIINNELGQKIGLSLKNKYNLKNSTYCTPQLLSNYLNDIQSYYMGILEIGMDDFNPEDKVVVKFSEKMNVTRNLKH